MSTIFFINKQCYGGTKIYHVLLKEGVSVPLNYVQKLMKQLNLRSIVVKNISLKDLTNRLFQKKIS
ncbi:IS3 family transposase [Enterococcus sp. ALS3]|uniref:IS3 family transposase n=1 Tax=Enterococcus alishanensis TaxID=1303817 RepID=A0ABS6TIB2_9ENTE|nr:IS3 family transposase [Enterococcus alishanensis]